MSDLVPPLFRRCGGTFPQGKVRERPPPEEIPALSCLERVPPVGGGCGGDPSNMKPGFMKWGRAFPSSVRAFGPATFPVGEGFLRRGLLFSPLDAFRQIRQIHPAFGFFFQFFFQLLLLLLPYMHQYFCS